MTKRQDYVGAYKNNQKNRNRAANQSNKFATLQIKIKKFTEIAKKLVDMTAKYLYMAYAILAENYVAVLFIAGVFILSLLLPDISQKLQKNNELKAVKNFVHDMTDEVNRAEVACLTAAEEMRCLHCALRDEETETTQELRNLSACTSRGLLTTQSEPVQVEKKIGFFRRYFTINRNVSKKEIAIMSILYTDSFDSEEKVENIVP